MPGRPTFARHLARDSSGIFIYGHRVYAKIYEQIFDSTLAENYQVRHVFEDLLKLADQDGVVDRTREAISRRTNVPLEIVSMAITELEKPDQRSRSKEHQGRRIIRLEEERDWGWRIVNHGYYRKLKNADEMRESAKERQRKYREDKEKPEKSERNVTERDLCIMHSASVQEGVQGEPTFEQAMERVPIQLREQVKTDFAKMVFDTWDQREGKDGAGISCRFEKLLQKRWNTEGEQWINGCHSAQKKGINPNEPKFKL